MKFFAKLFGSGRSAVVPESSDRIQEDVSRSLTPEKIDKIMSAANSGDTMEQCRLAREILEKNADIMQALNTRRLAVTGCDWHIEPGDDSPLAKEAAERLEKQMLECGGDDENDTFDDLIEDILNALLPGFSVSEILWQNGGEIAGFKFIDQSNFTFVNSFVPRLIASNYPQGLTLPRQRIVYHKLRIHGSDPVRGGLIRPLAWLHCFKSVNEKDLLSFIERYGMPFITAKVNSSAFDSEKNSVKRLIRNFGASGGGIFTRNVELGLLECKSDGEAFFKLLEYLEKAVNKIVLGQTASSGDSQGLSKGDAQSKVRQDILEGDCKRVENVINSQVFKLWNKFNYGEAIPPPYLVIDCTPPEDAVRISTVVKNFSDAGYEIDTEEISQRLGMKISKRIEQAPVNPLQGIPGALPLADDPAADQIADKTAAKMMNSGVLDDWLGPVETAIAKLDAEDDNEAFAQGLKELAENGGFGNSEGFENELAEEIIEGFTEGFENDGV